MCRKLLQVGFIRPPFLHVGAYTLLPLKDLQNLLVLGLVHFDEFRVRKLLQHSYNLLQLDDFIGV